MSLETISFFFGCMLIFIGVIGGGIEVKEIKIPKVTNVTRVISVFLGVFFLIVGALSENIFSEIDKNFSKTTNDSEFRLKVEQERKISEQQLKNEREEKAKLEEKNREIKRRLQEEREEKNRMKENYLKEQEETKNTKQPKYKARCKFNNEYLLITPDNKILSKTRGYLAVGKITPPLNLNCAFDLLLFTGFRYCVVNNGAIYWYPFPRMVIGQCELCVENNCN